MLIKNRMNQLSKIRKKNESSQSKISHHSIKKLTNSVGIFQYINENLYCYIMKNIFNWYILLV